MTTYMVNATEGRWLWKAESEDDACSQHQQTFPDHAVESVELADIEHVPQSVTLPLEEWQQVVSLVALMIAAPFLPDHQREQARRLVVNIADACPRESLAWWVAEPFRPQN